MYYFTMPQDSLTMERSHKRETPRLTHDNLKWQLSSWQRVSELHRLSFIQNFFTLNYPYELKKRSASVFIVYMAKT